MGMENCEIHLLNKSKLKDYLVKFVGIGFLEDKIDIIQFRQGQSNPTYHIKFGNLNMVLRKKPPGKLLKGAHQVDREFRIMKALSLVNFPVPKMIHFCNKKSIIGTEFFLMEFKQGRILPLLLSPLSLIEKKQCLLSCVSTLAQLHQINPDEIGLGDYGKKFGFCQRVLQTWTKQYSASAHKIFPEIQTLILWLESQLPNIVDESTIVHGDYSLRNIMFHPYKNTVQVVLDWELSTIGNPLMDLAYFCCIYYAPADFFLLDFIDTSKIEAFDVERLKLELPPVTDVLQHYCHMRKIQFPIPNWNFYLALNFFKIAAIAQGVYARGVQGNASSPKAVLFGKVVPLLIKTALQIVSSEMISVPSALSPSHKGEEVLKRVKKFIKEYVEPYEKDYYIYLKNAKDPFCVVPLMESWKKKARAEGLWNLFLPGVSGLTNVEYAYVAEELGRSGMLPEIFNCNAPDTGNMEVLYLYGDEYQKRNWLQPLLDGKIRSAFCMTEPDVASSDATNMELTIMCDGNCYIVDGRKWWSSGAEGPNCTFGIVLGKTGYENAPKHQSHSMIIVPFNLPGVSRVRNLSVFGYNDAPSGHSEIHFDKVKVPASNLILGEGRGFEIAQGRLGPGRIHHCMRSIGLAERCLEMMIKRAANRRPFGKQLLEHEVVQHQIAECRIAVDQCRLLTLHAAYMIDKFGSKKARKEIAIIKVAAPRMLCKVVDQAIQIHGGAGVSDDFPFAAWYAGARSLRIADGPDEVHLTSIAKMEIKDQLAQSKM